MKILHTSDLHLGHTLYGYDRTEEHQAILQAIENAVETYRPDALIISGDIYHTSQPSAAVQRMFSESISRIHHIAPEMVTVAIAGNHDSPSRHEVFRTPWRELSVHAIGLPDTGNPENHIIEVSGKGLIVAVPYVYSRNLPDGFYQRLLTLAAEMNRDNRPIVLAAHTSVAGCDFKGHEGATELTIGGVDAISLEEIGTGYDYLALGHIHRPQTLAGSHGHARYSGSPIAVSFDEDYAHSLSLVEIKGHGERPEISTLDVVNPHPLITLPSREALPWEEIKPLLAALPDDRSAYLRLSVLIDSFLPASVRNEAEELCRAKGHRFCLIRCERPRQGGGSDQTLTVSQFRQLKPAEIMEMYAHSESIELTDDILNAFKEAASLINTAE